MTQLNHADYIEAFKALAQEMVDTTTRKNSDYSTGNDAFSNFKMVEHLGVTSAEKGIIVRITDKLARVSNLLDKRESANSSDVAKVTDESIQDTLIDGAVYMMILAIYLNAQSETPSVDSLMKVVASGERPDGTNKFLDDPLQTT